MKRQPKPGDIIQLTYGIYGYESVNDKIFQGGFLVLGLVKSSYSEKITGKLPEWKVYSFALNRVEKISFHYNIPTGFTFADLILVAETDDNP